MIWYIVLYVVGVVVAIFSLYKSIEVTLAFTQAIALTTLVVSLVIPFAIFIKTKKWQGWRVPYYVVPMLGMYTVLVWRTRAVVDIVILISIAIVHVMYWISSIHSRMHRA